MVRALLVLVGPIIGAILVVRAVVVTAGETPDEVPAAPRLALEDQLLQERFVLLLQPLLGVRAFRVEVEVED